MTVYYKGKIAGKKVVLSDSEFKDAVNRANKMLTGAWKGPKKGTYLIK